ncbi:MAG: fumarate hydratase [Candidatus Omnitrophica bacterium]|nr:fumarate hydratase [Candidatus Omnitrophota bacterium]
MKTDSLQHQIDKLVKRASFSLRPDLMNLLIKAYRSEPVSRAKKALGWIIDNARIAEKENIPICQDTGFPVIFIELGKDIKISADDAKRIEKYLVTSYENNFLRASTLDPITRGAPSYKGLSMHFEFNPALKGVKLTFLLKGFGSENKSQLKMFNPTAKLEEIEEFVLSSVKSAGPEACPPFVVGLGIGGTSNDCLLLAKKALLMPLDKSNPDKTLFKIERSLFKKINSLGIGPMGFGGMHTVLAVRVKKEPTHIAGLPVGVNISCHALRYASIKIFKL